MDIPELLGLSSVHPYSQHCFSCPYDSVWRHIILYVNILTYITKRVRPTFVTMLLCWMILVVGFSYFPCHHRPTQKAMVMLILSLSRFLLPLAGHSLVVDPLLAWWIKGEGTITKLFLLLHFSNMIGGESLSQIWLLFCEFPMITWITFVCFQGGLNSRHGRVMWMPYLRWGKASEQYSTCTLLTLWIYSVIKQTKFI